MCVRAGVYVGPIDVQEFQLKMERAFLSCRFHFVNADDYYLRDLFRFTSREGLTMREIPNRRNIAGK
jgi:hypothetical protein